MDLTKTAPRSVSQKVLGIVQLARTTDKAKATADGHIGEYHYDCPMDQALFGFLGTNATDFLAVVKTAKGENDIDAYVQGLLTKKTPQQIETFNTDTLTHMPTGESLEHFNKLRTSIAPTRTDVSTWPDLLDLDEGRTVATRVTAKT